MKSTVELIIEALKSGKAMYLHELRKYLSDAMGKEIKTTSFSTVLSKLSKPEKSDIGHFIQRRKMPKQPYQYKLVDEALKMTTEELYALCRNDGKDRFTLEQAIKKYPGIRKYVKDWALKFPEHEKTEMLEVPQPRNESFDDNRQEALPQELTTLISNILSQGIVINIKINIRIEL